MTISEIQTELLYRIQERLGILCGMAEPTLEQREIAESEARQWVEEERKRKEGAML